jgi:hypothetical protein
MKTPKNIKETVIETGNIRINVSEAGLWIDTLDMVFGKVVSSIGLGWEELSLPEERSLVQEEYPIFFSLARAG